MLFYKQKYRATTFLWMIIHLSIYIKCSHQLQEPAREKATSEPKAIATKDSASPGNAVEEIVQDTILLLDALDQKLATVKNQTPSALMRDNLRALNGASFEEEAGSSSSSLKDEALVDEALVKLANGFTLGRKNDEQMVAAASDQQISIGRNISEIFQNKPAPTTQNNVTISSTNDNISLSRSKIATKKARQLLGSATTDQDDQLANDSTERHIRFTLDLMQSIFASQSYTAKTQQVESFLISPLSIQMVLMMMHLGARGQTRREISNCLHLSDKSHPLSLTSSASSSQQQATDLGATSDAASKLKRRHQQQQQHLFAAASAEGGKQQSANGKLHNSRHQTVPQGNGSGAQQAQTTNANPHELFGSAMRNLLKDPIVVKALTSANQIFLQKNLPLSAQYEWAIRHYYGADVKLVDFHHKSGGGGTVGGGINSGGSPTNSQSPSLNINNNEKGKLSKDLLQMMQQNLTSFASDPTANVTDTPDNGNNIQQMINDWIERQTRGKISNFLSSPIPTSTLMMAINVLYFKGDWQYKFDPTDTETDAWFTQANGNTVKLPMMVNRLPLAFAHDPAMKTSVIELPYKAQRLGLFLLLPDEVSGIFNTMQMLNSSSFANLISSMRKPSITGDQGSNGINVRIPKFSIESSPRLSQILSQQLGLKSLFTPDSADLSGMFAWQSPAASKQKPASNATSDQQVPIQAGLDELLHKAVLQVDEQGSVAAATSATIVERVGLFNSNYFEADHPFLLFLMDKQTGLVLFSGAFAGNAQENNGTNDKNMHLNNRNSDINRSKKQNQS